MIICPSCYGENYEGTLLCKVCNSLLDHTIPERSLEDTPYLGTEISFSTARETIILEVGTRRLSLPLLGSLVLGRKSSSSALDVIDLSPFKAQEMGVSRQHVRIHRANNNVLQITDLGSSNGTYINGERIQANLPYTLFHGDTVQLGYLQLQIYLR